MSRRPRFESLQRVDMTSSRLGAFIRTARNIAGRDACSLFSLEDVYSVAHQLGLSGVLFLEKLEDSRHVTVLLGLGKNTVTLYDPLSGVRVRACNETQLGMYSKPVGPLRDEFREYGLQSPPGECSDVWAQYRRTGKLLSRFLRQHGEFKLACSAGESTIASPVDLPALQDESRPSDCAPICLFIVSLMHPSAEERPLKSLGPPAVGAAGEECRFMGAYEDPRAPTESAMTIQIFVTGGTFDKEYDELEGKLVFRETHVQEMLKLGRCKQKVDVRTLMMVDSFHMTDVEREVLVESCLECKEERIVITHGTDSMEVTARVLGRAIKNKTVVLTGAMVPYKFGSSDGFFNLGSALAFAQSLPAGVYVAMNGRCFAWDKVRKNKETGEFEELTSNR